MRKWAPVHSSADSEWEHVHQIVVPKACRQDILELAHDAKLAGHLGIRKTTARVLKHFYWPGIFRDVARHCKTCHTCQLAGKPNQGGKVAPLVPIPAFEAPFTRVLVDVVGPLPRTSSGCTHILTLMDMATRYPEAIPLRNQSANSVLKAILGFFTRFGLPREV